MSKKKRKSLSESGEGNVFSDMDALKRQLRGEADAPDTETPDEDAPQDAPEGPTSGAGAEAGQGKGSTSGGAQAAQERPEAGEKIRMTFHIDAELAERLRNAVYWTPANVTLSGTARDALWAALEQLEARFNEGEPFPDRDENLQGGRPPSSG
jgi:hypothetical protein